MDVIKSDPSVGLAVCPEYPTLFFASTLFIFTGAGLIPNALAIRGFALVAALAVEVEVLAIELVAVLAMFCCITGEVVVGFTVGVGNFFALVATIGVGIGVLAKPLAVKTAKPIESANLDIKDCMRTSIQ